jgi:hypothetical protein
MDSFHAVDEVISQHLSDLNKPGVLSVRPGYQAAGAWLTKKPAIVVTVGQKRDDLPAPDRLPETLGGFPVDVRQAGPLQRLRASNPTLYAAAAAAARPELERPVFPGERDLAGQPLAATQEQVEALRKPSKPQISYKAPAGAPLKAVEGQVTITCHASPDAGWPTLKPFLEATKASLVVGMYDFTSAHILETVEAALKGKRKELKLVLDHPAPNKTRDQTDDETHSDLQESLDGSLTFAWALERQDPNAAAWIFPNAYHIKVAVRDGTAFWLSSGNWNNSNQPDIHPLDNPAGAATVARKSDRDWHVIVEHQGLAGLFEKYLANDLETALEHQVESAAEAAAALAALGELAQAEPALAARAPKEYFPPRKISAAMKIQPLLTPDNYFQCILPLINSAQRSFYMQTQYIHPSARPEDSNLAALIQAVVQKIEQGVDVRLIMSQFETLDKLELLQQAGVDLAHVRIQANVHNKGIVVDSKVVVVSSQNWSGDGVTRNRDAGLIIYNQDAAQYWEKIFLHDWTNMAHQQAAD